MPSMPNIRLKAKFKTIKMKNIASCPRTSLNILNPI